ncbi:MAG TPA: glycosyltransferase family A protein [bacterium]|nr:glycosyltransferase family A protein [bacterium]
MPQISIIIPTHNRPDTLKKAALSVLSQSYQDWELIIVDDGLKIRAESVAKELNDSRIKYVPHEQEQGGGAARNTGIKAAQSNFIAFLDDDDEWLPEKLSIQMAQFENTAPNIGFCFCAVKNITDHGQEKTSVPEGTANYFELSLSTFKKFLTVTLIIKKHVFNEVGLFDETLPSHQEAELMIRITKKFKGLGINQPLVNVDMVAGHEHVGNNLIKRIRGRELVLKKHEAEFKKRPTVFAGHLFTLGILYRQNKNYQQAQKNFKKAWRTNFKWRYFCHYLLMLIKH